MNKAKKKRERKIYQEGKSIPKTVSAVYDEVKASKKYESLEDFVQKLNTHLSLMKPASMPKTLGEAIQSLHDSNEFYISEKDLIVRNVTKVLDMNCYGIIESKKGNRFTLQVGKEANAISTVWVEKKGKEFQIGMMKLPLGKFELS